MHALVCVCVCVCVLQVQHLDVSVQNQHGGCHGVYLEGALCPCISLLEKRRVSYVYSLGVGRVLHL
jgi:hypothetical protein